MTRTSLTFALLGVLGLAACADQGTICDEAAAHLQSCGVDEPLGRVGAACDAAAATLAEDVLALECEQLSSPSGKSDGAWDGRHTAADDFKCSVLQMSSHCACVTWGRRRPTSRDYKGRSLTGRVIDADSRQPLTLAEGQWLEVKTANSGTSLDIQYRGVRVGADGTFTLDGLECDKTDLRVRLNDATWEPGRESPLLTDNGRPPLDATFEGVDVKPTPDLAETLFSLDAVRGSISVKVRAGEPRP